MNKPHKFKQACNGTGTYDYAIFCEYCGHISFDANRTKNFDQMQTEAKKGCTCSPQTANSPTIKGE